MVRLPRKDRDAQGSSAELAKGYVMATGNNPPIWTPVPDPTLLTTAALQREVTGLRELFDTKFMAYDKAIALLQTNADRAPSISQVEERVIALRALHDEKFKSLALQIAERDTRVGQLSEANQIAVNAAFSAAAAANEKQNANTSKQLDLMVATLGETTKGIVAGIDDLKSRVGSLENRGLGRHESWASLTGAIGIIGVIVTALIGVVAFFIKP